MVFKKVNILKVCFITIILVFNLLVPLGEYKSVYLQILLFFLMSCLISVYDKKSWAFSPLKIFTPIFFFYSASYSFFSELNGDYSHELTIPLSVLALYSFYLGILSLKQRVFIGNIDLKAYNSNIQKTSISTTWLIALLAIILFSLYALKSGATSKLQLIGLVNESGLGWVFSLVAFFMTLTGLSYYLDFKFNLRLVVSIATIFFLFAITGQRGFLFHLIFVLYAIYSFRHRQTYAKRFYPLLVLVILLLPISQLAKGFLITDKDIEYGITYDLIALGEFSAAGKNLSFILDYFENTRYGFELFYQDVMRVLGVEGAVSSNVYFNKSMRTSMGFHDNYGWGFSLVAESYLSFGLFGVIIFFYLLGFVTQAIYMFSTKGVLFLLFYINYMYFLVFGIRGDLASLLSLGIKNNLVFIMLIFLVLAISKTFNKSYLK